jgi:hypothetical protein
MHQLNPTVLVHADIDPDLATTGFPLLHPYLEQVWLPVIGPSTVLALRSIGRSLGTDLTPFELHLPTLAAELGLGSGTGPNSVVQRTIARIIRFGHARVIDPATLEVAALIRPVTESQVSRLPQSIQATHQLMTGSMEAAR